MDLQIRTVEGAGYRIELGRWQDSPLAQQENCVDVVISDAPYDKKTHEGGRRAVGPGGSSREICEPSPKSFDPIVPAEIVPILLRAACRWVVIFCALEQLGEYKDAAESFAPGSWYRSGTLREAGDSEWLPSGSGLWEKPNPTPQYDGRGPAQPADGIAIMHKPGLRGGRRWNGGGKPARWVYPPVNPTYRGLTGDQIHETQKLLPLMTQLVADFSEPGEVIWDPYGGSMTTVLAAVLAGREAIAHEEQEHYFREGAARVEAGLSGGTLREAKAGQSFLFNGAGI